MALEKETLVSQLEQYGGLWDATEIKGKINKMRDDKERRLALKVQLNFRQKVLGAKCDRSLFYLSCSGKLHTTDQLVANLNKIISWTSTDMAVENSSGNEPDTSIPVIISTNTLEKDKNRLHSEANKQVERNKEKEVGKCS